MSLSFKGLIIDTAPSFPEEEYKLFLLLNMTSLLQSLDEDIIKCVKVMYTYLTFVRINAKLDANLDCSIMDLWNSFTIVDSTKLNVEPTFQISLWSKAVKSFPSINGKRFSRLSWKGFSDIIKKDI